MKICDCRNEFFIDIVCIHELTCFSFYITLHDCDSSIWSTHTSIAIWTNRFNCIKIKNSFTQICITISLIFYSWIKLTSNCWKKNSFYHRHIQTSLVTCNNCFKTTWWLWIFLINFLYSNWNEIKNELYTEQSIVDKSNIIAWMFHMKMRSLLKDIKKKQIFDKFFDWIWIVKYQKRDLSHLHFFLFLKNRNNFLDVVVIDDIMCVKLSDLVLNSNDILRQIIQSQMIYDFCDFVLSITFCMIRESEIVVKYSKKYSRIFQEKIIVKKNDYFIYQRRNDNHT